MGPAGPSGSAGLAGPAGQSSVMVEKPLLISDILFDFDKSDVRSSEQSKISEVAAYIQKNPTIHLSLNGNADPRGANDYNLKLSKKRVENVRDALVAAGVPKDRIKIDAFGETRPNCQEKTEECWQKNRRVEVWTGLGSQASR